MISEENKILVVIPMYGQESYTRKCEYICENNAGISHDILIVDDGSEKPYVSGNIVKRLENNTGYTNAVNQGILYAQRNNYKYVLLLNNDTEPRQGFLKKLVEAMESYETIGVAGSARLYGEDDVALFSIDLLRGFQISQKMKDVMKDIIPCYWVTFCSVLLRMEMIREIGLLDKSMRTHNSDNDYCLRAGIAGWKVVVVPESMVFHHHSVTVKANKVNPENDQNIFLAKLAGLKYAEIMRELPLDSEKKTYGVLTFDTVTK